MLPSSVESVTGSLRRGHVSPVYYLTGDADVLKDELVQAITEAALPAGSRDFNLDVRAAADLDAPGLQSLVETLPVFAERRVVVIRSLEQWRKNAKPWEALGRYLENPSRATVLILVHGAGEPANATLVRGGVHVDVPVPGGEALRRWVDRRAQHLGLTLEPEAVAHLVQVVGAELGQLATELDKLAAAIGPEQAVGPDDVARLVGVNRGETVGDWVSAMLARDMGRALQLCDVVLPQAGVTAVRMIIALGTGLVGLRLARALADSGLAGARLERALFEELRKARPPGGRDWSAQARAWASVAEHWSGADVDEAIGAAYAADQALKSTTISDDRATLRTLILSLGGREVAA